eukprot:TRINITY_DN75965_c0_g1_i1.p1 TRINITY_DN75965_c0_g1~~TRINITY_DN75965_c0_g1_i1.p1  ORF type:complete len:334 (+),score=53.42 TRINITY_DN75965_c0_g1_i1:88-1089(+)
MALVPRQQMPPAPRPGGGRSNAIVPSDVGMEGAPLGPGPPRPRAPPVGAPASDSMALFKTLKKGWKPSERISLLEQKVQEYATTHHCNVQDLRHTPALSVAGLTHGDMEESKHVTREMQILQKVVHEGEEMTKKGEAEMATVNLLKTGMRDFIDFALDEVDRFANVGKGGHHSSFSWRTQGHVSDNPCLRRSLEAHSISDGGRGDPRVEKEEEEDHSDEESGERPIERRPSDIYPADFMHDFSRSLKRETNAAAVKDARIGTIRDNRAILEAALSSPTDGSRRKSHAPALMQSASATARRRASSSGSLAASAARRMAMNESPWEVAASRFSEV